MLTLCLIIFAIFLIILILSLCRIIPLYSIGIFILLFFILIISFKHKYPVLYYVMFTPADLYTPIVYDDFNFHEEGFTKTYPLKPKYNTDYIVGLSIDKGITSKYKFNGELQITFFKGDKFLFERVIERYITAVSMGNKMTKYKKLYLFIFKFPILGKYSKDIKVKIKVLKGDKQLEPFKDSIKLYIAASGMV